jgi:hypothetical protein
MRRWKRVKVAYWAVVQALGATIIGIGDRMYWAGKNGMRRNRPARKFDPPIERLTP